MASLLGRLLSSSSSFFLSSFCFSDNSRSPFSKSRFPLILTARVATYTSLATWQLAGQVASQLACASALAGILLSRLDQLASKLRVKSRVSRSLTALMVIAT
ncbi:hypothetical protein ACOSQ3_023275 [Xanthoceras sorbifolium]